MIQSAALYDSDAIDIIICVFTVYTQSVFHFRKTTLVFVDAHNR